MLGRIIAFTARRSLVKNVGGVTSGPAATAIALVLPMVLRRLGPGGMIAAAVGGHVVRRVIKHHAATR